MAVILETSLGSMFVELHTDECPKASRNFLKLCKLKYYNSCIFHKVEKDFIVSTGDPTGTGEGGQCVDNLVGTSSSRFFEDELNPHLKHAEIGTVAMANAGPNLNASQFFITTKPNLDFLDGKHTVFGQVVDDEETKSFETLAKINAAFVDPQFKPLQNIRIRHCIVIDDPFDDSPAILKHIPDASPVPVRDIHDVDRLPDDEVDEDKRTDQEIDLQLKKQEAKSRAEVLEMLGDIPDADIKPPDNVLFVCKLNPATRDEDLELIFSRFGSIKSCEVIKDWKTGDSLQYAFIEFETAEQCEQAYFKMEHVLIDDRRIHVDFSQSVAKLWNQFRRGDKDLTKGSYDDLGKQTLDLGTSKKLVIKSSRFAQPGGKFQRDGHGDAYSMVFDKKQQKRKRVETRTEHRDVDGQHEHLDRQINALVAELNRHKDKSEPRNVRTGRESQGKQDRSRSRDRREHSYDRHRRHTNRRESGRRRGASRSPPRKRYRH